MQILVNTDHTIQGREALVMRIQGEAADALERFADQLTRVELYIADENGPKAGVGDIRCTAEARAAGRPLLAVTNHANALDLAVTGALTKLVSVLEHSMQKVEARRDRKGGNLDIDIDAPGRLVNTQEFDDLSEISSRI